MMTLVHTLAVAEYLNFRHAANALGVAQSSVSARVKALEEDLGILLFERYARGVRLTEAGRHFVERVAVGIDQLDHAVKTAGMAAAGECGRLRIGIHALIPGSFLVELIAQYREGLPGIEVDMTEGTACDAVMQLRADQLDIVFVAGAPKLPDCHSRRVWTEPLLAALPASHHLAEQVGVTWADLAKETFLVRHGGTGPQVYDHIVLRLAGHWPTPSILRWKACSRTYVATRFFSQVEPPPRFIRKLKEPPLNRTNIFFGESHSDWLPVRGGESGDFVFRRGDGHAFAKIAPASRRGELAGERDRLIWLKGRGVACPEVINWQEEQEGACLVITAIPGVPAADLSGADLLKAWPSMGQQLGAVHSLSVDQCPFERRLSRMFGRAVDVVSRNAVNPDFLPDEDKSTPQLDLLARVERELPVRLDQERTDMVVCHGDPCMPNFMVDPKTLQCTGLIDLGRLGTADRYADLALMIANAEENWAAPDEAERAFAVLFNVLGIEAPDRERLAFYLRLDPLTWG